MKKLLIIIFLFSFTIQAIEADIDQHDLDPRISPRVQLNDAEQKVVEGKGNELEALRQYYVGQKDRWYRFLGKDAIESWIKSIDDIMYFHDQIIKDFFIIKHGNTEEVQAALERLRLAQEKLNNCPNRSKYSPHGLLLNQYRIAFAQAANRKDGAQFKYVPDARALITRSKMPTKVPDRIKEKIDIASKIQSVLEKTIHERNDRLGIHKKPGLTFLAELNDRDLFVLQKTQNNESEFKRIFKTTLYHYFDSLLRNHPFQDRKSLIIAATHFGAALVCNMVTPGGAFVYYAASTGANWGLRLAQTDVQSLTFEDACKLAAEEAAGFTWNYVITKAASKVSEMSKSIQQSAQKLIDQTKKNIESIEINQPGNIVISDKNKIPLVTKLPHPPARFPELVSQLKHIFRKIAGHFEHDTPVNRQQLLSIIDPKNYCGPDSRGNSCYSLTLPSGQQLWAYVFNKSGIISDGGINEIPRSYNPITGFSSPYKPTTNKKKQ